jgi:hypothetical protein
MNCQTFSDLIDDLAGEQIMDAAMRTRALAHAEECIDCAVRLKAQRRVTSDLRELIYATKDQTAAAVVWERLSCAFDARDVARVPNIHRKWIYAAGAIAAMLFLAFTLLAIIGLRRRPVHMYVSNPTASTPIQAIQTNEPKGEPSRDIVIAGVKKEPRRSSYRRSPARQAITPLVSQPKEIATDFIPLTYVDTELGSGAQIVRVQLPRSAMANFGLPVNMDRADQPVKADVLLSADGLARAIRFVQ